MPSTALETFATPAERAELEAVLRSARFSRSPALAHLLSYLCEKKFAGESSQIKEYSVGLEVFGRSESFDQETDSIVRVQANRLRRRLAEYYGGEGAGNSLRITIPVGQYVPVFEEQAVPASSAEAEYLRQASSVRASTGRLRIGLLAAAVILAATVVVWAFFAWYRRTPVTSSSNHPQTESVPSVGLPVGDEVRIGAGASRSYVDHAGKLWSADTHFSGGTATRSQIKFIWRTQDPALYRSSREGDFSYNIPLKPGKYELHLHFAETFYGPEDMGGGEGSRIISVTANGQPLLTDLDVLADAGGGRTADVKVFTNISPAADGQLHLRFFSVKGGAAMLSAIEILPGSGDGMRPVRILTREVPYYSNDSQWWSPDVYFKGGQLASSDESAVGTDDPELYETERWGHFSYSIPATPGRYTVILHFIELRLRRADHSDYAAPAPNGPRSAAGGRVFDVFCNGRAILQDLNILEEAGENRPLTRKITGLEPNAQGKLVLEFVPVHYYATVTAIEVLPQWH